MSLRNLFLFAGFLSFFMIAGCSASGNLPQTTNNYYQQTPDSTDLIYWGDNMMLNFVTGMYFLQIGPFMVSNYSKIRISTFGNSGSGTITVLVCNVDTNGNTIGLLENFNIDMSSSSFQTRVYDVPGHWIRINYQSLNPCYVSCCIFGS